MLSHNSSLTTSSNLSSDHGVTFSPCMGNEQEPSDIVGDCEATPSSLIHDDIFMFDQLDEGSSGHQHSLSATQSGPKSPSTEKYAESNIEGLNMERSRIAQTSCNVASVSKMATCTRCGKLFNAIEDDGEVDLHEECGLADEVLFVDPMIETSEEKHRKDYRGSTPCVALEAPHITPDHDEHIKKSSLDSQLVNDEPPADCLQKCPQSQSTMDTTNRMHGGNVTENLWPDVGNSSRGNSLDISSQQCSINNDRQTEPAFVVECDNLRDQTANHHNEVFQCLPGSVYQSIEFASDTLTIDGSCKQGLTGHSNLKVENTEGAGISLLLLQKSSSNKWPVIEGRPLAHTNIICSEPYYTRDGVGTLKRTIGLDSSSASSSIDQGSTRQSGHLKLLKSSNHHDFEKSQISSTTSCKSIASMSDMSTSTCSVSVCPRGDTIVDTGFLTDNSESSVPRTMICTEELNESCKYTLSSAIECWSAAQAIVNVDIGSTEDVVIQKQSTGRMAHKDNISDNSCSSDTETCINTPLSLAPEESCIQKIEEGTSVGTPEHPDDDCDINSYQMQHETIPDTNEANRLDDGCVSVISEEDMLIPAAEANIPGNGMYS